MRPLLPLLAALLHPPRTHASSNYTNPIVSEAGVDLGDPGAIFVDGFYYLATSSGDTADAFPIHRSADLASWSRAGAVFPQWKAARNPAWAQADFWAPDLQKVNSTHFAVYFSANFKGLLSLGVAFSRSVTGPYVDSGRPLWANHSDPEGTIDVHMHQRSAATGGGKFLLWKANQNVGRLELKARIQMQRLSDDGAALVGAAWTVATADQAWETFGCVEAPWLVEHAGDLFLFYSGSMVNWPLTSYAVGVARAPRRGAGGIEQLWEKRTAGPILHRCGYRPPPVRAVEAESAGAAGTGLVPGHCSVLPVQQSTEREGGQDGEPRWAMFYHGRADAKSADRVLMMEELRWGSDGWPYVDGGCPSNISTPVP